MVVIKCAFHLNVICYALDFFVRRGNIEDDTEREMMSQANILLHHYRNELEKMRENRKSLK